jgi:tetratricopeptide (TPR) repeat protein
MNPDPFARVRFLFYDQNRWDLAERELQKHPELLIDRAEANAILGHILLGRDKFDEARAFLRRALEIDSRFANAYFTLAVLEKEIWTRCKRRHDRAHYIIAAEEMARQAIRLDNESAHYRALLATILIEAGKIQDALTIIEEALSLNPDHVNSLQVKARALIDGKRRRDAIGPLHRALEIDPQNAMTHVYLYRAKIRISVKEAQQHLERALELAPNDRGIRNYCLSRHRTRLQRNAVTLYLVFLICYAVVIVVHSALK